MTGQKERAFDSVRRSPTQDCSAPEMHQLDFWIGEWAVQSLGRPAGTTNIQATLGGCALIENWSETALSLAFYDPMTGKWHRNRAGSQGEILEGSGELRDGAMHFSGTRRIQHRCTLTLLSPDQVREVVETTAGGSTASTGLHELVYIRRK